MNVWLSEIWRSWRASLRKPGFLLLASGVLALGVAASSSMFTLIDQTLLKPLPVAQSSRLVMLGRLRGNGNVGSASPEQYQALSDLPGVASMGLIRTFRAMSNISGGGMPVQVSTQYMDHHLLPTLGIAPALGRNFDAREDTPHGPKAIMLSHGFWERRYGGNPDVIGQRLDVEGVPHTIVGVLPASFATLGNGADIVLPTALEANSSNDNTNYFILARLADGVGVAAVAARIDARLHAIYRGNDAKYWKDTRFGTQRYAQWRNADRRPVLLLFLASAVFVLLIALVNLTNLMLLRSLTRSHDAAVRNALGASRLRLLLPALAEGVLVGMIGVASGWCLAVLGLDFVQQYMPSEWLPGGLHVDHLTGFALGGALGLAGALVAAGLGLWRSRHAGTVDELREGGRNGLGVRSGRISRVLVVAQVALATTLLCAAGLFLHTLYKASSTSLGFSGRGIVTFDLSPVKKNYPGPTDVQALVKRVKTRLRRLPGVEQTVAMTNLPVGTGITSQLQVGALHLPGGEQFTAQYHGVGAGFFRLFGVHVRRGRRFTPDDRRGGEKVAIVNRSLARERYDGHALGKLIQFDHGDDLWSARIVGVVADTRQFGPLRDAPPVVYVPFAQMPDRIMKAVRGFEPLRFALRVKGNPAGYRALLHKAVADIAPGQPIAHARSMQDIVHATTADMRLNLLLVGLFASLAVALAAAGLYAVMAVAVAAREREFGVRSAMGASPLRLTRLVLKSGLLQILFGLALGVIVALTMSGLMRAVMAQFGNRSLFDPAAIAGVCIVLALSGLLACLLPALRAARVQPMRALKAE